MRSLARLIIQQGTRAFKPLVDELRPILNYPLLSGEAAEKWSLNFVARPALLLSVVTAATCAFISLGPVGAGLLAVAIAAKAPRKINAALNRQFYKFGLATRKLKSRFTSLPTPKRAPQRQYMAPRRPGYRKTVRVLRTHVEQILAEATPLKIGYNRTLSNRKNPSVRGRYGVSERGMKGRRYLHLDLRSIWGAGMRPQKVKRHFLTVVAHETGHQKAKTSQLELFLEDRLIHDAPKVFEWLAVIVLSSGLSSAFAQVIEMRNLALFWPIYLDAVKNVVPFVMGGYATKAAALIWGRQHEYDADRRGLKLTRDPRAAISLMLSLARAARNNPRQPMLLQSVIGTHPCSYNRIREMRTYWGQLAAKGVKQRVMPPPEYRPLSKAQATAPTPNP